MRQYTLLLFFIIFFGLTNTAHAQDPFIGEIRMFAGNFAPRGWAFCDGGLLQIAQNSALFSILGTTYGGDGRTTFGLPDLRGRVPLGEGRGEGLSNYRLGQEGGRETNVLSVNQLPAHSHTVNAVTRNGDSHLPTGNLPANTRTLDKEYSTSTSDVTMGATMIGNTGGNQSVENRQPYTTVNFIIALEGIFPSRN